jgi:hypothetical protein
VVAGDSEVLFGHHDCTGPSSMSSVAAEGIIRPQRPAAGELDAGVVLLHDSQQAGSSARQ